MSEDEEAFRSEMKRIYAEQAPRHAAEEEAVRRLGDQIGYGRVMQLGEEMWRRKMVAMGYPAGSEHSVGPCVCMLERCPHLADDPRSEWFDANGHCDWCCGAGRVTKRVAVAMRTTPTPGAPHE